MASVLVAGAGGFIGGYMVQRLLDEGNEVRAVDIKPKQDWWQLHAGAQNVPLDLKLRENCKRVCRDIDHVYNFAADMGGIGFIETHPTKCLLSVLINTHLIMAAVKAQASRYFYASSACIYPAGKQDRPDLPALREEDAMPADPEGGYGWEKLFAEVMLRHFREAFGLETRAARYHNIFGPKGSWRDGREKAPAAICRKVAEAKLAGKHTIDVWGDGTRTRSFTWIDDCIEGTRRLMDSDVRTPLNIGSSEQVSINGLIDLVEDIAGVKLTREYDLTKPMGVQGRNSDNAKIRQLLGWEPQTRLADGMKNTYEWVAEQVATV